MKIFILYVAVIFLVQFCLTVASLVVGFLLALCLAWLPARTRAAISSTLAGIAGVAAAISFGYLSFYFVLGSNSFGIGAFIASTLPLVIPILNDQKRATQLVSAQRDLPQAAQALAAPTTAAAQYSVVGYILGLVIAIMWFFNSM
jgi:hypothetical protein